MSGENLEYMANAIWKKNVPLSHPELFTDTELGVAGLCGCR